MHQSLTNIVKLQNMSGPTEGTSSLEDKISDQVLIKSVQAYLNEELEVKIIKKNIKLATKPGDNYVSFVYQVGVTYMWVLSN